MELLKVDEGKLSVHAMAWFVMWYSHKIADVNVFICPPYLARHLKTLIGDKGNSVDVVRSYLEGEKGLTGVKAEIFLFQF